jgi:hypothetical protein
MQQWEYQVIHLNVDSSTATKPGVSATPDAPPATPPFTKTYLEQEFPSHYGPQQPPGAPAPTAAQQSQHPAVQLQGFINGHGRLGWELLGIFPLGNLLMMIFRRPLEGPAGAATNTADLAGTGAPAQARPAAERIHPESLQVILDRLEALEHRLAETSPRRGPAGKAQQDPGPTPPPRRDPQRRRESQPDWILAEERLQALRDQPVCSTAAAARQLGFRSPASLLNPAAMQGYPKGLVRVGPNGKAAVYTGLGPNRQGGRELRLWFVVDSVLLPPPPA